VQGPLGKQIRNAYAAGLGAALGQHADSSSRSSRKLSATGFIDEIMQRVRRERIVNFTLQTRSRAARKFTGMHELDRENTLKVGVISCARSAMD
jgi:hypothetical protein